jgi:hypothetical protein
MYTLKWSVLQYVIIRPRKLFLCTFPDFMPTPSSLAWNAFDTPLCAVLSIVGIICEAYGVLCYSAGHDFHFAAVYISIIDFISISCVLFKSPLLFILLTKDLMANRFALYGLIVFYGLTHDELKGRKPLAKFLSIKLIVMFTFYQSFVVRSALRSYSVCFADAPTFPFHDLSLTCSKAA